jgi:transcriptional regulator with XRE-family HTH domain
MKPSRAEQVGEYLRIAREAKGLSQRRLALLSGINQSTVIRVERGDHTNPSPDTLKALARALELPLEELRTIAGYGVGSSLPEPMPFLRAKYKNLPDDQLDALTRDVATVLREHGIDPNGRPSAHEDEESDEQVQQH